MLPAHELLALIRTAWAGALPPGAGEISLPTYDDEGVSAYFSGTRWEGHTARQLRRLDFAPSILTAKAFAYYLPAYMIADIEDPTTSDTNVERVLYELDPVYGTPGARGSEVIALLDEAQRRALKAYIDVVQDREQGMYEAECSSILNLIDRAPGARARQ